MTAALRRLSRDRRGVISLELALLANLVLLPLTLGAVDAAELVAVRGRLDQVLHAALFYAYANAGNVTTTNVQTYAKQAYGTAGTAPNVLASITAYCITPAVGYPATGTPAQPTNSSCANSSQTVQSYLAVTATVAVALPFTVPWSAKMVTLTVSGRARIA